MPQKRLKDVEYPQLQVSADKRTYRILLPISYIRYIQSEIDRELEQGEPMEVSLLSGEIGLKIIPMQK